MDEKVKKNQRSPKTKKAPRPPKEPKPKKSPTKKAPRPPKEPKPKKSPTKKVPKPSNKKSKKYIKDYIGSFRTDGISFLSTLNEEELSKWILDANAAYADGIPFITDTEYDIVVDFIRDKYPKNIAIGEIGAPVIGNKVNLPYNMPSMNKIKPDTRVLLSYSEKYKGPYLISCKLDGVSGMYDCIQNPPKLYTRGDGTVGQDISHLLKFIKLPILEKCVIRGEFIIPKDTFHSKYKTKYANPRNLVTGIINSKTQDERIKDVHFVAYEIIHPQLKTEEQFNTLLKGGFEVVKFEKVSSISGELLSLKLIEWRDIYLYEIDGIIVSDDKIYARTSKNPDHAFAFKMVISDQVAEAIVVDVEWTASKDGYLKPRVRIEPIKVGGVTIQYATGFNANFIETQKIGVGAVIQIIRSGDVIPHIVKTITPAKIVKMPSGKWHWTETHIDIILDDIESDKTVNEKNITGFFTDLKVIGLAGGNVKKIIDAGFNSIPKILKMSKLDFSKVVGFKTAMVNKIYDGIQKRVKEASLVEIMVASNKFGRGLGERRIKDIMDKYPQILTSSEPPSKMAALKDIGGIGEESYKMFLENMPEFMLFLKSCDLEYKLKRNPVVVVVHNTGHPLYGKIICMTKIRDTDIINFLKKVGAIYDEHIKKNTFILIVKSMDDVSNKTKFAEDNNIQIMDYIKFKEKYL